MNVKTDALRHSEYISWDYSGTLKISIIRTYHAIVSPNGTPGHPQTTCKDDIASEIEEHARFHEQKATQLACAAS